MRRRRDPFGGQQHTAPGNVLRTALAFAALLGACAPAPSSRSTPTPHHEPPAAEAADAGAVVQSTPPDAGSIAPMDAADSAPPEPSSEPWWRTFRPPQLAGAEVLELARGEPRKARGFEVELTQKRHKHGAGFTTAIRTVEIRRWGQKRSITYSGRRPYSEKILFGHLFVFDGENVTIAAEPSAPPLTRNEAYSLVQQEAPKHVPVEIDGWSGSEDEGVFVVRGLAAHGGALFQAVVSRARRTIVRVWPPE